MRINNLSKVLLIFAIAGIVGFAATSFAGWGRGGGGNCWGQGTGWSQRDYAAPGYQGNLSDEDSAKLEKERQAFFEETSDIRDNLYQKELELRSELAKKDADAEKAVGLQKEISDLESQLDQKRLAHRIKMKKENPQFADRGDGYGEGRRMGPGYGSRGMRSGYGFRGPDPGYCQEGGSWD